MENIRTRGGRYQIRFYDSRRRPKEVVLSFRRKLYSKRDIQRLRDRLYLAWDDGWDPWTRVLPWDGLAPTDAASTLKEAVENYLEYKRELGRRGQHGGWNEATHARYSAMLRQFRRFAEKGKDGLPLRSLQTKHLEDFIFRRDLADASKLTYRRTLNTFVCYLQAEGLSPVEMPPPLRTRTTLKDYLTESEMELVCQAHTAIRARLMEERRSVKPYYWMPDAFRVMFYQGLRRAELLNLRRGAVDLEGRRLRVGDEAFIPKGRDERVIPILKAALPILDRVCIGKTREDRLFAFEGHPNRVTEAFRAAAQEAVPDKDVKLKSLRDSCGYYLAAQGVSPWDVRAFLRHKSLSTTEKHYVQSAAQEMATRIDRAIEAQHVELDTI